MTFASLLHATRGRPEKAVAAMKMWHDRSGFPTGLNEHIFSVNADDVTLMDLQRLAVETGLPARILSAAYPGSAAAWAAAAEFSFGNLLVQVSDDMEPPDGWLTKLCAKIYSHFGTLNATRPMVIAVSDGFRKDKLLTTFICNRAYHKLEGFLCAEYQSVFSDTEATVRAYQHAKNGTADLIEARDMIFFHRHHYHDKSVPFDQTYRDQNSAAAYATGRDLFLRRNGVGAAVGVVDLG